MKIKQKIKEYFLLRKARKEYLLEVSENYVYNKYKLIKINDLLLEYKKGENAYTILRKISDIL